MVQSQEEGKRCLETESMVRNENLLICNKTQQMHTCVRFHKKNELLINFIFQST